ncbi:hypothetical protein C8R47DRAFT_1254778 [Mycena vitilis]|nr:hypothetical protein C8R47DRAFT_1254778 [Mycena vitilis]
MSAYVSLCLRPRILGSRIVAVAVARRRQWHAIRRVVSAAHRRLPRAPFSCSFGSRTRIHADTFLVKTRTPAAAELAYRSPAPSSPRHPLPRQAASTSLLPDRHRRTFSVQTQRAQPRSRSVAIARLLIARRRLSAASSYTCTSLPRNCTASAQAHRSIAASAPGCFPQACNSGGLTAACASACTSSPLSRRRIVLSPSLSTLPRLSLAHTALRTTAGTSASASHRRRLPAVRRSRVNTLAPPSRGFFASYTLRHALSAPPPRRAPFLRANARLTLLCPPPHACPPPYRRPRRAHVQTQPPRARHTAPQPLPYRGIHGHGSPAHPRVPPHAPVPSATRMSAAVSSSPPRTPRLQPAPVPRHARPRLPGAPTSRPRVPPYASVPSATRMPAAVSSSPPRTPRLQVFFHAKAATPEPGTPLRSPLPYRGMHVHGSPAHPRVTPHAVVLQSHEEHARAAAWMEHGW